VRTNSVHYECAKKRNIVLKNEADIGLRVQIVGADYLGIY